MPKKYEDGSKFVAGLEPQVITGAPNVSRWVDMALHDSIQVLWSSDVGTSGEDVTLQLRQATSAAGAGAKDLDRGQWHIVQSAGVLGDTYARAGSPGSVVDDGETRAAARVEVTADQLDDGYRFVALSADNSGSGSTKLGSAAFLLAGARFAQDVPDQPSVLG